LWGSRRSISGKRVIAFYPRRDAGIVEPLIPRMDAMLERACANLNCPALVTVSFETAPNRAGGWGVASFGRGPGGLTLNLLSPTLTGLPADGAARDELYRAIEIRLVQDLVGSTRTSRRLRSNSAAYRQLVRWHLAQAGLSGPFISPEITHTLAASVLSGTWRPLDRVVLELSSGEAAVSPNEAMIALAFQFITERFGADALARLTPSLATSPTVGEAINTALRANPATLEPEWESYLRAQAGPTPV
jgi:hypothetical protein